MIIEADCFCFSFFFSFVYLLSFYATIVRVYKLFQDYLSFSSLLFFFFCSCNHFSWLLVKKFAVFVVEFAVKSDFSQILVFLLFYMTV